MSVGSLLLYLLFLTFNCDVLALSDNLPSHLQVKIASSITKGERRSQERQSAGRKVCGGCLRPEVLCLCDSRPDRKFETKTTILVLQHPNEFRKKTFSTVPLMSLVLENVHIKVGYNFAVDDIPLVRYFIKNGRQPLLLFPSDRARSLETSVDFSNHELAGTRTSPLSNDDNLLILLDGTWAEAKRMATQSPELLSACQHVAFSSSRRSLYDPVRKEPEEHCLSTLEAAAEAIELLEGAKEEANSLRCILQAMVDNKLEMERSRNDEPRQKGKASLLFNKNHRRRQVQTTLFSGIQSRMLEEGVTLRQLEPRDASVINQNWYHPTKTSLKIITERITRSPACIGIDVRGELCAHLLHGEDGSLNMLHVDEKYRSKGFGKVLIEESAAVLKNLGKPRITFIKAGDLEREQLFTSLGWKLAPGHESSQGQRKWILPSG